MVVVIATMALLAGIVPMASPARADLTSADLELVVDEGATGVSQVHYSFTGPASVAMDWRGGSGQLRYGPTAAYGTTVQAQAPSPMPFSSVGPFWEASISGLQPNTDYHYSIDGGPDAVFATAPTGPTRFVAVGDIGSTVSESRITQAMAGIAADDPSFFLGLGDLTYGSREGQVAVDQHFDDVMAWSRTAAYMPVWGNHEWESPNDDLRNYKGRFALPNAHASVGAPAAGCCGEDWGWFDAAGVRFISYPEPYTNATWTQWRADAEGVLAAAQANPTINFIVTFGHRPAYSSGGSGNTGALASILDDFGDAYSKYVLDLNGHTHVYERFEPIHNVTHITAGTGGAGVSSSWSSTDPRTAFRARHIARLRVDVTASSLQIEAVCGPPTSADDRVCANGQVLDSVTIDKPGVTNRAPVVTAGADATVIRPDRLSLAGSVTDDGLPAGSRVTSRWTQVSGPATATFTDPADATTTVGFSRSGSYVLRLTGSDGELTRSDTLTVTVSDPGAARPDGRIRRGSSGRLVGDNVYNTTGTNQTRTGSAVRGQRVTYDVSVQNDGAFAERLRLRGQRSTPTFTVRYRSPNDVNITNQVTAGTFRTPVLAPRGTYRVSVVVTVLNSAPRNASVARTLTAISTSDTTIEDTVRFIMSRS